MSEKKRKDRDYLWDRSGPVDSEVAELEELLAPLRYERAMPAVDPPLARPRPNQWWWLAVAAGVALVIWGWLSREGALVAPPVARMDIPSVEPAAPPVAPSLAPEPAAPRGEGWNVQVKSGAPKLDGSELKSSGKLAVGAWMETDEASRARVDIADIGTLDVEPGSRLRIMGTSEREHRVELSRGEVHAFVDAPPRVFLVQTPSVTFVDLGCEYQLSVADDGGSILRVTTGWVALETPKIASYVPAGAMCRAAPDGTPGLPVRRAAPAAYIECVHRFEQGEAAAVADLVSQAQSGDEVTLWHLLGRVEESKRRPVYDKIVKLTSPADDVAAVLRADKDALERWGRALGVVPPLSWTEGPPDPTPPVWNPSPDDPAPKAPAPSASSSDAPPPVWNPPQPQPGTQPPTGDEGGTKKGDGTRKGGKGSKRR